MSSFSLHNSVAIRVAVAFELAVGGVVSNCSEFVRDASEFVKFFSQGGKLAVPPSFSIWSRFYYGSCFCYS